MRNLSDIAKKPVDKLTSEDVLCASEALGGMLKAYQMAQFDKYKVLSEEGLRTTAVREAINETAKIVKRGLIADLLEDGRIDQSSPFARLYKRLNDVARRYGLSPVELLPHGQIELHGIDEKTAQVVQNLANRMGYNVKIKPGDTVRLAYQVETFQDGRPKDIRLVNVNDVSGKAQSTADITPARPFELRGRGGTGTFVFVQGSRERTGAGIIRLENATTEGGGLVITRGSFRLAESPQGRYHQAIEFQAVARDWDSFVKLMKRINAWDDLQKDSRAFEDIRRRLESGEAVAINYDQGKVSVFQGTSVRSEEEAIWTNKNLVVAEAGVREHYYDEHTINAKKGFGRLSSFLCLDLMVIF